MPPKTAIISDIHGNLEALEAVLADIDHRGIPEVICLGDIVGYGPDPAACVDLVRDRCRVTIRGNHDDAAINGPIGFTPLARDAIEWTERVLRPRFWRGGSRGRWDFLKTLPLQTKWQGFLLVHGSPRDPTSEYIMDREILFDPGKFEELFALFDRVCLVGHTHIPGVYREGPHWTPQRDVPEPFQFEGTKLIINVGSVGQPRDKNPRACYLGFDADTAEFQFYRVDYDWEKTRDKIHAVSGLNNQLGDRLGDGI